MKDKPEKGPPVTLIVRSSAGVVTRKVDRDSIRVGRSERNDLVINNAKASRFHCRITRIDDQYFLEDMGSRNGTRLNGVTILRKRIQHGDRITVGDREIFFGAILDGDETRFPEETPEECEDEMVAHLFRERSNLIRLAEVTKALNSEIDLSRLLELIIDSVIELTDAERGFLITLDKEGEMEFEVARNFMEAVVDQPELAVSRSIAGEVIGDLKPVMSINAREDDRFRAVQSIVNLGLRSVLCVPLILHGEGVGALYVDNRLAKGVFSDENRRVMESFADQAAIAIENARRMAELREKNAELLRIEKKLARANSGLASTVRSQSKELKKARARLAGSGRADGIRYHYGRIVGSSRPMKELVSMLERIIESDFPVLIQGESGTGKDLVASALHFNGRRAESPFVSENCAALPESLLESELFGHEKGAFTGAVTRRQGLLEIAHTGTLFLDEVGDMSVGMQAKLLRFLQDGEFRPVGGAELVRVDVRVLSATNQPLEELVAKGAFREDLFYRLNVLPVRLPPLRERKEDIPDLISHFLDQLCTELGQERMKIDAEVVDLFCRFSWPGNVRDLENEMRRLVTLSTGEITIDLLSDRIRNGKEDGLYLDAMTDLDLVSKVEAIEKHEITEALRLCRGNKSRAARRLGISRFTLQRKIDKYGVAQELSE
jgi:transcriptional regulator with GAF, ATPase, and Fis domain